MKRWKFIRANLANLGYTTLASTEGITITNIDSDGWLYYTDEHGDQLKVLYPATTPIVVNSDTSTITVTVTNYLAGVSGYTAATVVTNENDLVVTPECTFATGDATIFTTGGTYGETLIAVGSGTTTLTVIHNDGDTISGTTTITVGTVIVDGDFGPNPTGETISSATTYNVSDVWYSNGQNIPFNINSYSVSEQIATLDLSTGIITPTATGTTVINITDEASGFDSSTGFTLNISVPAWDYEGIMTVGTDGKGSYGWDFNGGYGSMDPDPSSTPHPISDLYIQGTKLYCRPKVNMAAVTVEINGQRFELMMDDPMAFSLALVEPSPFPAVGETCTIKFLYTLA